jgi:LysM repeat protein
MLAISGCQLRGAEPAPLTPFEPSDTGGEPVLDAGTTDDEQQPPGGETDGPEMPADDGGEQPTDDGGEQPADDGGIMEPTDTGPIDVFGTQTAEAEDGEATDGGEEPTDGGEIITPEGGDDEQPTDDGEEATPAAPTPVPTTEAQPTATPTPDDSAQSGACTYVVQRGDTLFRIAQNNGLTTEQLAAANGITDPDDLQPGTELVLPIEGCPGGDEGPITGQTYTVRAGDTLFSIAQRFGVTVEELATANGIEDTDVISVGDVLTIP